MKKSLIIIVVVSAVLAIITTIVLEKDNIKFKLSYEFANYTEYSNGKSIKVNIPMDNRIKYINPKELLEILKSGTGIVYFGYNTCPWCRNSVPILIDVVKKNDIDTIYYVDIHGVNLKSIEKRLYKILDEYLSLDEDGEKRLAVPDVYVVKKGKIMGHHLGTVPSYKNPTKGMSKKQKKELRKIYTDLIKELK